MNTHPQPTRRRAHPRRSGFTLMETVLAMVLGAMVLLGSAGVFLGLSKMESTFSSRFDRTSELGITQTIMNRAMLSLQMEDLQPARVTRQGSTDPNAAANAQETDPALEEPTRERIILETDPSTAPDSTGWIPQRLEIVNAIPPVPAGLATQAAEWFVNQDRADSNDFSALDGSQGVVRGVFELRPSGQRERIMQNLGLISTGDPMLKPVDAADYQLDTALPKPDWTLWWRPILSREARQLTSGIGPLGDTIGTPDDIRARLAGAVPLLRHIERCQWEMYREDAHVTAYAGSTMSDLPAYTQFEVILTNSQYASWMFEIDWVIGDDPSTAPADDTQDDTNDDNPDDDNTNGRPGGRPGGQIDPDRVRNLDFSGDS
ncbi:MAG: PulJ/GspJ family protein [Phycisphaerales bacterium]